VNGAHLALFHPATGKLVAGFSVNDNGDFSIAGLDPGVHVLRVEPLDDADVESFFDDVGAIDVNFSVTFFDQLVIAPKGGGGASITVDVGRR
jgi:hypothetical protein